MTDNTYKSFETEKEKEAYQDNSSDTQSDIVVLEEGGKRKLIKRAGCSFFGFPAHVILMLLVEFCERFSFYGIRSCLSIYLQNKLNYTQAESSTLYHLYIAVCYVTPILGGIIADQYWGKYKTILILGTVYAIGNGVVSAGSLLGDSRFLIYTGFALISFGTGGIKPCISSFCGDQLDPNDSSKRESFFSVFYICINIGAMISSYMTPQWARPEHHEGMSENETLGCFGNDDCYPKAFGIPSVLMFVALFLFTLGTKWYHIVNAKNNVFTKFLKTTLGMRKEPNQHFRRDCRRVLKIVSFILPVSLFWAIFDQAGSTFTFQSAQLDKTMAGTFFESLPVIGQSWLLEDQVEAINPILILIITPLFTLIVYPIVNTFYKLTALRKIGYGMAINCLCTYYALKLQQRIDDKFTYIYPENNPSSPLAMATFVYQIDRPDNTTYNDFARTKFQTENFDVYDEYRLDQRSWLEQVLFTEKQTNYAGRRMNEIYDVAETSGKTSRRFWSWKNGLGADRTRNDESILHPEDFESRLHDKSHCPKAWKQDLPYITVNNDNDYLMQPASLNKFIVFSDFKVSLMKFNHDRPEKGRARLDVISTSNQLKEHELLKCRNTVGYKSKDPFMNIDGDYEVDAQILQNQNDDGDFEIGSGSDQPENDSELFHIPAYNSTRLVPQGEHADIITSKKLTETPELKIISYGIPQESECIFVPTNQTFKVKTNGLYSIVDYESDAESDEREWANRTNEDLHHFNVHFMWQLGLYSIATASEIMISVSGLEYTYAQAPQSMKAVVSSLWLLPVFLGNMYDIYMATLIPFKRHAWKIHNFNVYFSALSTLIFIWIASKYETVEEEAEKLATMTTTKITTTTTTTTTSRRKKDDTKL